MEVIPTKMLERVIGKRERGALMNMRQWLLLVTCVLSVYGVGPRSGSYSFPVTDFGPMSVRMSFKPTT
jgi:hypothetical protein